MMRSYQNFLSFLLLLRILAVKADQELKDAPCEYKNTVDLSSSQKFANGSYLYDDIIVPAEKIGTYNYEILIGKEKTSSKIHVRGCICDKLRPCISICCPDDKEFFSGICNETDDWLPNDAIIITTNEGKTVEKDINHQFAKRIHRPCEQMYCLTQVSNTINYSLFENGSMFSENDGRLEGHDQFCLGPVLNSNSEFLYEPWKCYAPNPEGTEEIIQNGITKQIINSTYQRNRTGATEFLVEQNTSDFVYHVMLSSVPFMLITIVMCTFWGKKVVTIRSNCFYLLSLSVAFTTLAVINLSKDLSPTGCTLLGYTTYFAFMASYSWLFVSSFDFYLNLSKQPNPYTMCRDLTFYSLFAWGLPTCLLGIVLLAQRQDWPDEFKPNIGGSNYCFFESRNYNVVIYFYGPGVVLISSNVVMFFMTIKKISCGKLTNACKPEANGFKQKLHVYMKKCGLLAKLSLVTGVSWTFEFLAYWFQESQIIKYLLYFVECQGYLIFLLVAFRKSNRTYLKERYQQIFEGRNLHSTRNKSLSNTQQTTLSTHKAV